MHIPEAIISLIAPHLCVGCGAEGSIICSWCSSLLADQVPSRCFRCHQLTREYAVCRKCRPITKLKHVWVAAEYTGLAKLLVQACKYERVKVAAQPIADQILQVLPYLPGHIVVHVPTATSRRRQRGYDQAELIAKKLAKSASLEHASALLRTGHTRQVGASRDVRKTQPQNAFVVHNPSEIKKRHILLVDDITTTGSTLVSAARQLRLSGAASVSAAIFAQKQ